MADEDWKVRLFEWLASRLAGVVGVLALLVSGSIGYIRNDVDSGWKFGRVTSWALLWGIGCGFAVWVIELTVKLLIWKFSRPQFLPFTPESLEKFLGKVSVKRRGVGGGGIVRVTNEFKFDVRNASTEAKKILKTAWEIHLIDGEAFVRAKLVGERVWGPTIAGKLQGVVIEPGKWRDVGSPEVDALAVAPADVEKLEIGSGWPKVLRATISVFLYFEGMDKAIYFHDSTWCDAMAVTS